MVSNIKFLFTTFADVFELYSLDRYKIICMVSYNVHSELSTISVKSNNHKIVKFDAEFWKTCIYSDVEFCKNSKY